MKIPAAVPSKTPTPKPANDRQPQPKIDTPEAMVDKDGKVIANGKSGKLGEISKFNHSFLLTAPDPNITKFQPGGNTPAAILASLERIQSTKIDSLFNFGGLGGGIKDKLNGLMGSGPLSKLSDAIAAGKKLQKDVQAVTDRIQSVVKTGMDIAKQATDIYNEVRNDALGALEKYAGNFGDIGGYIKDGLNVYKVAKDTNWRDLNSIMSASSAIFGTDLLGQFVDVGAAVTFVGGLVKKAQELQMPEFIDKLKNTISHHDELRNKLSDGVGFSASASDIRTLNYLTGVLEGEAVTSRYPNFKGMLLSNYRLPEDSDYDLFPHYRDKVQEILGRFDPSWFSEEFNNEMVHSLSPWTNVSEDAKKLFADSEYAIDIMIASTYPSQSIVTLLKRDYKHYYG